MTGKSGQGGVALVAVLLVVAIATVMAVSMVREQQASIRVTGSFLARGQASQYALGGEELARQILYEDFEKSEGRDHLAETWASPELQFEFEEGEVNLRITDLQGLFNLNGLAETNTVQNAFRQRLVNLVGVLGGDPAIADRLQDWLDQDDSTQPAGAEDFEYLAHKPPYRAANGLMLDVSEFALLGSGTGLYRLLAPYLTALPDVAAPMNVNTAPPLMLQALAPGLSLEAAEALALRRDEEEGFENLQAFLQAPELAGLQIAGGGLGVQSAFFEVRSIARYHDRFSYLTSIVHRDVVTGAMQVIHRDFSRNFRPEALAPQEEGDG